MNTRLSQFLNAENITQAQFADSIGVARASISHIISGRNKPSYEFISAMMRRYPQVNPEWLILGKGRMYNDTQSQTKEQPQPRREMYISGEDLLFPTVPEPAGQTSQESAPEAVRQASQNIIEESLRTESQTTAKNPSAQAVQPTVQENAGIAVRPSPAVSPVRQRVISRIIVFFDDGTFQEMRG